jgi:hypothetical protein
MLVGGEKSFDDEKHHLRYFNTVFDNTGEPHYMPWIRTLILDLQIANSHIIKRPTITVH